MDSETRSYRTGDRETVLDITDDCTAYAEGRGDGLLHVFVPHATAGIAILETGAGSDDDLLATLGDLLPADDRWRHRHGSHGHGRSHVMPALVPPYATVPVPTAGSRSAPGRASAWSTSTSTTPSARCDSASWPADDGSGVEVRAARPADLTRCWRRSRRASPPEGSNRCSIRSPERA